MTMTMTMTMTFPYKYTHKEACGKVALFLTRKPHVTEVVSSRLFKHLDGSPVLEYEAPICDTCGKGLLPLCIENVERV